MPLDPDRVVAMLEMGAPTSLVAERLNCSARHVRRIRKQRDVDHDVNDFWGSDWERQMIWGTLADLGFPNHRIAWNVGRSRQAVAQWRKEDRRASIERKSADPDNWH